MKRSVFSLLALLIGTGFALNADANDSAFAKIQVKGIAPGSLRPSSPVRFYGKNAADFFAMLPPVSIAGETDERESALIHRFLAIESGSYSLNLSCEKARWNSNTNRYEPLPHGTECTVAIGRPETEGDSFDYKPGVCK